MPVHLWPSPHTSNSTQQIPPTLSKPSSMLKCLQHFHRVVQHRYAALEASRRRVVDVLRTRQQHTGYICQLQWGSGEGPVSGERPAAALRHPLLWQPPASHLDVSNPHRLPLSDTTTTTCASTTSILACIGNSENPCTTVFSLQHSQNCWQQCMLHAHCFRVHRDGAAPLAVLNDAFGSCPQPHRHSFETDDVHLWICHYLYALEGPRSHLSEPGYLYWEF